MTTVKKLILSLAFACAAVAVQPWPAAARIATNGSELNGLQLNGMLNGIHLNGINPNGTSVSGAGGAAGARGLDILEIELPQAVIEYPTKE